MKQRQTKQLRETLQLALRPHGCPCHATSPGYGRVYCAAHCPDLSDSGLFNDEPQSLELVEHPRVPIYRENHSLHSFVTSAGHQAASGLVEYSVFNQGWIPEKNGEPDTQL